MREQEFSMQEQMRLLKADHEKAMQLQEKLLSEGFEEERKRMKDRFETQLDETTQKYERKIRDLEEQLNKMAGRSELSNA